ncbi:MAG: ferredoxin [Sphingobacteriales bacterium]|nr:ferredoxin [Sphingobacteriales bacterium]
MHKVIHYRKKCIGCGVCYEQQPELWRMSKKDGKATLIRGVVKKEVSVLAIPETAVDKSREIAAACPVRIIKVS